MRVLPVVWSLALAGALVLAPALTRAQEDEPGSVASSRISIGTAEDAIDLTIHQWRTEYPVYWLSDEDYCRLFSSWIVEPGTLGDVDTVRCEAQLALIAAQDVVHIPEAMLGGMGRVIRATRGNVPARESGTLIGSRARTTEPFWLSGGDYVVTARKGKGKGQSVKVVLKDTYGETHATLADPPRGGSPPRQVVTLLPGSYYLVVTGSPAKWRIGWEPAS